MTERTLKRIVELHAPVADVNIGRDGASEDSEAVLRSSKIAAGNATAAKSSSESNTMIALEGEMAPQGLPEVGDDTAPAAVDENDGCEDEQAVCSETTMIIEKDTLCIFFPNKIRGDAVVIEVMLEINPLYIEGKTYATFILAGLPHCKNGAYINFRIDDEDDWKFHTFPALNTVETGDTEENKLHGILDLNLETNPIHLDRSVVIRTLRCPMVLEVLGFEMKTNVHVDFSWSPLNEKITGEFEITLSFLKVESDEDAKRSVINLFLINGPERQDGLSVDSPGGSPTDFVLGDREFQNNEISARRCRLLRVERLTKDVNQTLRIRFNKQFTSVTQDVGIPFVRTSGDTTILEESVTIINAKLPLEAAFTPNSKSWKPSKKLGSDTFKTFTRIEVNIREPNPSVSISCLQPAMSPTAEAMNLALIRGRSEFIDRIDYKVEESECFDDRQTPIIVVKMSFELDVPPGVEPMGEIVRFHIGSFAFQFVTINGGLTGKGVLFEDGDELIVLNFGILDGTKNGEKLLVSAEWFGEQASILSLQLNYQNKATSGFTKGKVILLGMDTDKSEIFFHIPCKSVCKSLYGSIVTTSDVYGTVSSNSRSFGSLEDQKQPENSAQEAHQEHQDAPPHWMWEMKETLMAIMIIWMLCMSLISQSKQNSALRASLRQTTTMLEKREIIIHDQQKTPPKNEPHAQSPRRFRGGSEDTWWSVVGLEDTQEIGQFKIGFLKMDNPNSDHSTCDPAEAVSDCKNTDITETGTPPVVDMGSNSDVVDQAEETTSKAPDEPKDWAEHDNKELQKRVALLLQESFAERAQSVLVHLLELFWHLIVGGERAEL
ncbi:uncharacterized protein LAJ45_06580 [Morchella importuna]|uniref:uncharacterized protein n=1 Tax=Morchella importuna TaxID=1174673 RepID=UPI001E8E0F50|nr:uncharacterized protein LAJ45_06580 [Morchella importuna]KAH8149500.1 hypothetical protein LAJ45_06580 [Morchella importuna]